MCVSIHIYHVCTWTLLSPCTISSINKHGISLGLCQRPPKLGRGASKGWCLTVLFLQVTMATTTTLLCLSPLTGNKPPSAPSVGMGTPVPTRLASWALTPQTGTANNYLQAWQRCLKLILSYSSFCGMGFFKPRVSKGSLQQHLEFEINGYRSDTAILKEITGVLIMICLKDEGTIEEILCYRNTYFSHVQQC